jgi:hypothetical protein
MSTWQKMWLFVLCLTVASVTKLRAEEDEAGFKPLFDGKSLAGWEGDEKFWSVQDGCVVGEATKENPVPYNTFLVWRDGEVDDFVLRFSIKLLAHNSGVQYRSKEFDKFRISGYQADIEEGRKYTGILYEEGKGLRGIVCERGHKVTIDKEGKKADEKVADPDELQSFLHQKEWNEYEVIAQGPHLIHKINGHVFSEVIDEQEGARAKSGLLALQLHAGKPMRVEFKNMRIKRTPLAAGNRKLVILAGHKSHQYGEHAFFAGSTLLKKRLDAAVPNLVTAVYKNDWPKDESAFDNADALCIYSDGGDGHPFMKRLDKIEELTNRGVSLGCLHYAVEVPKGNAGEKFLGWIGGYFETWWSVNPTWSLQRANLIEGHPITRGVKTFATNDEWYYHMRFRENMQGVSAILSAVPPAETVGKDGHHSGNAEVRKEIGKSQVLAWAVERPDGGRGFGFTGGHYHVNWSNDDCRKMILNAMVWLAKLDVPAGGVESAAPDLEELELNQDFPFPGEQVREKWKARLLEYHAAVN